jgi:hypothetical protein
MKNLIKLPAIVLGLMLLMTGTAQRVMAQDDDISLQSFYDELSPYGTWIQDPQYGYVWRPDVEQDDFRPYYSNGRWAMTEYGNTWVSNYDWGWAPFHYGRWVYNRYRQWIWIPDTVWGPAWVSWRSGGGYYGWAPMGPSINININFGIPDNWWVFIPQRNIYYDSFPRYYSRRNVTIIHNTTIINNTYERNRRTYYTGPRVDDVRRATRGDVQIYNVNRTSRSGRTELRGNDLNIYNPRSSRADRGNVQGPRDAVRGDANLTRPNGSVAADRGSRSDRGTTGIDRNTIGDRSGRPDRGTFEGRNPANNNRAERTNNREGIANPSRDNNPSRENNAGNRTEGRATRENNRFGNPAERNTEIMPVRPDRGSSRENRQERSQPTPQTQPAPQPMPVQPQARPQREERRAEPQVRQERPQPQRMERQERSQPQAQPQRMERQERQSAPPTRSEGRGSGSENGRSSRSGRG